MPVGVEHLWFFCLESATRIGGENYPRKSNEGITITPM